jgi:RNA polymerase sigma factor (sigma-70 family)
VRAGRFHRGARLTLVASSGMEDTGETRRPDGSLDWSQLMARAQDGDRHAYRMLLEDMAPYLRSLAARSFKEPNDVEDTVQDVLLTVHAIRNAYDPGRPFGPWLLAIANRRIIDRLRRQARAKIREVALAAEHETFSDGQASFPPRIESSSKESSVSQAALHQAIENLPPDQRQAIRLLKLEEMSLKEAAATSGRSVAALKVATHRAIANLRKLLRRNEAP